MGTTWTHKSDFTTVVQFIENEFRQETNFKLLKACKIGCHVFCAIQNLITLETHAEVAIVHTDKKLYHNIGIKWVHEDCGPYAYNCPVSIIKLLTQREVGYSKKWREGVKEFHSKAKEANLKAKGLTDLPSGAKLLLYGKVYTVVSKGWLNKGYNVSHNYVDYKLRPSQLKHCTLVIDNQIAA